MTVNDDKCKDSDLDEAVVEAFQVSKLKTYYKYTRKTGINWFVFFQIVYIMQINNLL